jgi:hypothetical protein
LDAKDIDLLSCLVRRENRSLAQYVSEAFPWVATGEQGALTQFQQLVREEREAAAAVARYLARQRSQVPYLGPYPVAFTTINFVSFEHLLPLLIKDESKALAERERELATIQDPDARVLVQNLVDLKRRHLKTLASLAEAHPATLSTVH